MSVTGFSKTGTADKINIKAVTGSNVTSAASVSGGTTYASNTHEKQINITSNDLKITTVNGSLTSDAASALNSIFSNATGFSSGKKIYIASTNGNDTNVYEITGGSSAGFGTDDKVKLIVAVKGVDLAAANFDFA